ncbi:MAG: T9SS type A sorting domain-containing protein [Candidatus Eisenbacteria bacterium]|nr:T9SS type A sorting domain-containing protein [Candidatus Eisenbacteria bacterium]
MTNGSTRWGGALHILASVCAALSIASGAGGASIEITSVPVWGSEDDLRGRVHRVSPSAYKIAVYILVAKAGGWWVKPTAESPLTPILPDSTWSTDITTGGIDPFATRIIAFLVPSGYNPPRCDPCSLLADSLFDHPWASACRPHGSRRISFSGIDWIVKKADALLGPVGPGPNYFSDDPEDVWVDAEGLHLSISPHGDDWYASEVIADTSFGYGTYGFRVRGAVDILDPPVVFGMFTWDDCSPFDPDDPDSAYREIDIEIARWGNAATDTNAQFVVQPWHVPGNLHRFPIRLGTDDRTIHYFTWAPDTLLFWSRWVDSETSEWKGESWLFVGDGVPRPGGENPRINLWLYEGNAPESRVEALVTRFEFVSRGAVGLEGGGGFAPSLLHRLDANRPNPFRGATEIRFVLGTSADVNLSIYNVLGQKVRTLLSEEMPSGAHAAEWDGTDDTGAGCASGAYFYRMEAGGEAHTGRMHRAR